MRLGNGETWSEILKRVKQYYITSIWLGDYGAITKGLWEQVSQNRKVSPSAKESLECCLVQSHSWASTPKNKNNKESGADERTTQLPKPAYVYPGRSRSSVKIVSGTSPVWLCGLRSSHQHSSWNSRLPATTTAQYYSICVCNLSSLVLEACPLGEADGGCRNELGIKVSRFKAVLPVRIVIMLPDTW